jgi:hypothetical protein
MYFLYKIAKHSFGNFKVGYDPVFEWPNSNDASGGATQHALGFSAHRQDAFAAALIFLLHGDDRRLITDNSLVFYINKRIGGPKVDCEIVGKDAEKGIEHQATPYLDTKTARLGSIAERAISRNIIKTKEKWRAGKIVSVAMTSSFTYYIFGVFR